MEEDREADTKTNRGGKAGPGWCNVKRQKRHKEEERSGSLSSIKEKKRSTGT